MTTYDLPLLPVGWHWQQHPCSVAFVVARGPDGQHSKPLPTDERAAIRRFVETLGIRVRYAPTEIQRIGYSTEECEQWYNTHTRPDHPC